MMTLAPELPGATELIDRLIERGVAVSLGHTDATAEQANAAFDRGARSVTHLFNAMRPFLHRDPGIVGAALAREDVVVWIIVDGIHLAPETVRVTWRAARERLALVTDAITGAGLAEGSYSLGNLDIRVHEGTVRGPDGVLAGSVLTMDEAVRNLHALGVPFEEAVAAATSTPARVLGEPELGRIDVGLPADLVVLERRDRDRARARRRRSPRRGLATACALATAMRPLIVRLATHYLGALHRVLYRASGGRIGARIWGLPIVLLTTTGRASGRPRTVPLCSLRDGESFVVIASYGGLDRPPSWWLNLQSEPRASVQLGRSTRDGRRARGDGG